MVNPVPSVKLAPLYPGDAYVDWVGIDGYFTRRGEQTFDALFAPTITQIRKFAARPAADRETGAEPGAMAPSGRGSVQRRRSGPDLLGFVYFNQGLRRLGDRLGPAGGRRVPGRAAADRRLGFRVN